MKNVNSLIKDRTVNIYDGSLSVAKTLRSFESRKITAFTREQDSSVQIEGLHLYKHLSALAASENTADVCLLDGSALKVLVVRYPADARCVLARIAFRSGWLIGVPGLLRRVVLGRVRLGGVRVLVDERGHKSYWLVLDRASKTRNKERLFVPRDEGVQAFLDWLRAENINYVVPRFYESLPRLHREDGDLDLLVSNEDKPKVVEYVRSKMRDFSGSWP